MSIAATPVEGIDEELYQLLETESISRRTAWEIAEWLEEQAQLAAERAADPKVAESRDGPASVGTNLRSIRRFHHRRILQKNQLQEASPKRDELKATTTVIVRSNGRPKVCRPKVIPLPDKRHLVLVQELALELKDTLLGDPVNWKPEANAKAANRVKAYTSGASTFDGGVSAGNSVILVPASVDDEPDPDPEVLELIGDTFTEVHSVSELGECFHPTFGKAPTANLTRRELMQASEVDFDPTDTDNFYMLDGEHACSLSLRRSVPSPVD